MRRLEALLHASFAAGACVTLGFMVHAGRPSSLLWFLGAAPFAAWALAPFVAGAVAGHMLSASGGALAVLLSAGVILAGATAWLLDQAFIVNPDAQSALVFLFLPFYQIGGLLPFLAAAAWLHGRPDAPPDGQAPSDGPLS